MVVNGENAAGGRRHHRARPREELLGLGADAITLGNHAYRHRDVYEYLDREPRIVRPANYPKGSPGRGHTVVEANGLRLGVVNLSGQVFLEAARSPFAEADALLAELRGKADAVLVDIHAEATSEKVAMGWHLDGRVTGLRRHPHPRADGRRARAARRDRLHHRRRHDRPARRRDRRQEGAGDRALPDADAGALRDVDEDPWLNAVLVEGDSDGRADVDSAAAGAGGAVAAPKLATSTNGTNQTT